MAYREMNLVLYVALYGDDAAAARKDYRALKELDDYGVIASVVLTREANGDVDVDEHGGMQVGRGATMGGVAGLVVGLFAPPLLAATAVGAGIGAAAGKIAKHHDEKRIESAVDALTCRPNCAGPVVQHRSGGDDLDRRERSGQGHDRRMVHRRSRVDAAAVVMRG